ncbi:MAG: hypothetical protein IPO52_11575 [Gemmatimonadetes bacterium]|nr:hypothetical protein [Gemmatimonadota bacterium]
MTTTSTPTCDRCDQPALRDAIHVENSRHQFCRHCYIAFTAEYLAARPEKAAELAATFRLPWPETGVEELARILVAGQERQMEAMRR